MVPNISLPLLCALGIRILLNLLNPAHVPDTADHILQGLWQGVLLYHALVALPDLALPVAVAIAAKLVFDFSRHEEDTASRSITTLVGIALGVLVTNVLSQFLDDAGFLSADLKPKDRDRSAHNAAAAPFVPSAVRDLHPHEAPSRRLRLVSFGRSNPDRHRSSRHPPLEHETRTHRHHERDRHPHHAPAHDVDLSLRDVVSPAPTHAYSIDTQPSISIESFTSSIDPQGIMTPAQRQVAILRARASLADSERRRFKEERKWAISQGNRARASQLEWQVKRFTALMESYHREADAKVVEAARAADSEPSVPFLGNAGPSAAASSQRPSRRRVVSQTVASSSRVRTPPPPPPRQTHTTYAGGSTASPLVSVTVGTAGTPSRTRKRSTGSTGLKPAIHVHPGAAREFLSKR